MLSSIARSSRRVALQSSKRQFANMPVPQSSQAKLFAGHPESEGWESTIAWFYPTSFLLIVGILALEPETGIDVWAKQEAAARLKLKQAGMTEFEFGKHYQDLTEGELKSTWDVFSNKAMRMTDDDDEDEEEDEDDDE